MFASIIDIESIYDNIRGIFEYGNNLVINFKEYLIAFIGMVIKLLCSMFSYLIKRFKTFRLNKKIINKKGKIIYINNSSLFTNIIKNLINIIFKFFNRFIKHLLYIRVKIINIIKYDTKNNNLVINNLEIKNRLKKISNYYILILKFYLKFLFIN